MIKLALRGLFARRLRALMIMLAVFLGVAMISGTFVLTDTINGAFSQLFLAQTRGADAIVSPRLAQNSQFTVPQPFSENLLSRIRALPEVERAGGQITDIAEVVERNGKVLTNDGAPTFALSYPTGGFTSTSIVSGRAPTKSGEVVLDTATAARAGLRVGDSVKIATKEPLRSFRLVGLASLGAGSATAGDATFVFFDFSTAQTLFNKRGKLDLVYVAARGGVSPTQLAGAIRPLLPSGVQVRTVQQQVSAELSNIGQALGFVTKGLLAFGFIAVVVGAFTIFNTFSITVVQRTRELGLLCTLGATRGQVMRSFLLEAFVVALIGSVLGLLGGIGFAKLVDALFKAFGANLPSTSLIFKTRTIVVGLISGIIVTQVAALIPALRATRVVPVEALRLGSLPERSRGFRRLTNFLTVFLTLGGLMLVFVGLYVKGESGTTKLITVAGGAVSFVIGVAMFTPHLVRPVARLLGSPLERMTHVVGRLARENTARVPARTAITSVTLMIGLAVIVFVTIFANGVKESVSQVIKQRFTGDIVLLNVNGYSPFPLKAAEKLKGVPGLETVSVFQSADSNVTDVGHRYAEGIQTSTVTAVYHFDWIKGSDATLKQLGDDGVLLESSLANSTHLSVGDTLPVTVPSGRNYKLKIRGIYKDNAILLGFTMDSRTFARLFGAQPALFALANVAPHTDQTKVLAAANAALKPFPEVIAESQTQLQSQRSNQINQILDLFYALLAFSVIIAIFGIVNTLTLSIHERKRELGLLRAVGMTRRDVRRMIRYESVITATIGGALGLALGIFFAFVITKALSSEGIIFAIPIAQVIGLLILVAIAGVIAAIGPARRAAKLDLLDAIATE